MQNVIPVGVKRDTARLEIPITSTWGEAGALVDNATDSTSVRLYNIGDFPFEYQIDAGDWTRLELRNSSLLSVSLASTEIRLRKSEFGGDALALLEIDSLTDDFYADGAPVSLGPGPGGGATAFTDLTDGPGSIVANGVVVGNGAGDGLVMSDLITVGSGVVTLFADAVSIGGKNDSAGVVVIQGGNGANVAGGDVSINSGHASGDSNPSAGNVNLTGGYGYDGVRGAINITAGAINVNGTPAIDENLAVPYVGNFAFTHGLLTVFDGSSPNVPNIVFSDITESPITVTDGAIAIVPVVQPVETGSNVVVTAGGCLGNNSGGALTLTAGYSVEGSGGAVLITGGQAAGVSEGSGGGVAISGGSGPEGQGWIDLSAGALTINTTHTIATQEVLVAGVGTLTFTHGLLTGFVPA